MSAEKFKADLEAADRKAAAIAKLSEIIEFRLGKTHNNQALINDIVAAGLLDTPTVDVSELKGKICYRPCVIMLSKQGFNTK